MTSDFCQEVSGILKFESIPKFAGLILVVMWKKKFLLCHAVSHIAISTGSLVRVHWLGVAVRSMIKKSANPGSPGDNSGNALSYRMIRPLSYVFHPVWFRVCPVATDYQKSAGAPWSWEQGAQLGYQEFQKEKNFDSDGEDENEIFDMIAKY